MIRDGHFLFAFPKVPKDMKLLNQRAVKARSLRALESAREDLRANILVRRAALQLSQADLAARSGVSRPVLSKIETASGDFQISALAKLAAVLNCPVSELLAPGGVSAVADDEIVERFKTPRSKFVKSQDLWAAINEVQDAKKGAAKTMDRGISSGRRKRSGKTLLNASAKSRR